MKILNKLLNVPAYSGTGCAGNKFQQNAQCTNSSSFGSAVAPTGSVPVNYFDV
jgi:hypothetical protein